MMIRALTLIAIYASAISICHGQLQFNRSGSAAAYAQQARMQRDMREAEYRKSKFIEDWRAAKKLTLLKQLPNSPHKEEECLSLTKIKDNSTGYLDYWRTKVIQVLGSQNVLLAVGNRETTSLWLSGYPTKGIVDGEQVRLIGLVTAIGTKTYDTVDGSTSTVRVIRFSTLKEIKIFEAQKEAERLKADEVYYRTWTDSSGKHSTVAKFLEYRNGQVHLQRKSGAVFAVELTKLCKQDRTWVQKEVKSQRNHENKKQK